MHLLLICGDNVFITRMHRFGNFTFCYISFFIRKSFTFDFLLLWHASCRNIVVLIAFPLFYVSYDPTQSMHRFRLELELKPF